MLDTNALLSIAFALVANFTNVVPVPPQDVPISMGDLKRYNVHSQKSPANLALFHKNGASFWIVGGVVQGFESPGSYFVGEDPEHISRYSGNPILNSNEVARLAVRTIERLAKIGNPIANLVPKVRRAASTRDGREIPFYHFTWPPNTNSPCSETAEIEIDARNGQVVNVLLWDRGFFDYTNEQRIMNAVYRAEPHEKPERPLSPRAHFPPPTTNQVLVGISNWLCFCKKLNLDPGEDTTLSRIDWDRTYIYTNRSSFGSVPTCQVWFRNGVCFQFVGGVTISHVSKDACFTGFWDDRAAEDWRRFHGRVTKRWKDLARAFEELLTVRFGVSSATLLRLPPTPAYATPEFGAEGLVRCVVRWHEPVEDAKLAGSGFEPGGAFAAEFDLQTGEIKYVSFYDPTLLGWKDLSKPR